MKRSIFFTAFLLVQLVPTSLAAERTSHFWTSHFRNGDRLRVEVDSLTGSKLVLRPFISPDATIIVELNEVEVMVQEGLRPEGARSSDRVRLRNGSILRGSLVHLQEEVLEFELDGGARVRVPRRLLVGFAKHRHKLPSSRDRRNHLVTTRAGGRFVGDLQPRDDLLAITSEGTSSILSYEEVATVTFPFQIEGTPPPSVGETEVELLNGSKLIGRLPAIANNELTLKMFESQDVSLSLKEIGQISFPGRPTEALEKGVLLWGYLADRGREYSNTLAALKSELPDWPISEDFSSSLDNLFRLRLSAHRTLVIAEPEVRNAEYRQTLGRRLKPIAEAHLRRGGNIVVLAPSPDDEEFLREAGLVDLKRLSYTRSGEIRFTPETNELAAGLDGSIEAINLTAYYEVGEQFEKTQVWATYEEQAVAVVRQDRNGWIAVLGLDFYERSPEIDRLLANAVRLRTKSPQVPRESRAQEAVKRSTKP